MIRHHASQRRNAWAPDDFLADLDGLEDDLVNADAYASAVNLGRKAVPGTPRDDDDPVVEVWLNHIRPYAADVPARIAGELADAANDAEADPDSTVQDVLDRIDTKLDALRSSVTRYADPPWGAGWNGYGLQLEQRNILMDWVLDDGADHCDTCPSLADGSPYEQLPTWPKMGDTPCRDRCWCTVQANKQSWDESLGAPDD